MKGSFNDRVRQAIEQNWQVEAVFMTRQVGDAMNLSTQERKRLRSALHDLTKYGEVERLGQGRWRRTGREERPELRQIMWGLLRIHLVMTTEKMCLSSGASPRTAKEFFEALMNQGLVANEEKRQGRPGRYRLIKDPGPEPPKDEPKAEKLRQIRAKQKQEALNKLDVAWRALGEARLAVSQLEEG